MDSTELRDQFRADVVDQLEPFLWSEDEVYGYIGDAQSMFCRLTGGLADASSTLTRIAVDPAIGALLPFSPLILKVRDAYLVSTGLPVEIMNYENLAARGIRLDGRLGAPQFLIIGMDESSCQIYPLPVAVDAIQMLVDRLPLKQVDDADQKLEVASHHKSGLCLWVKARAYSKQDAETFDRNKAEGYEQKFRAYCAEAKREKDRAKHRTRTVVYGGI